jgi:hypothetical protein
VALSATVPSAASTTSAMNRRSFSTTIPNCNGGSAQTSLTQINDSPYALGRQLI